MSTTTSNPELQVIPEELVKISPLINSFKADIKAILECLEQYQEHLDEADRKCMKQLKICALILDEE